jgi:hypothetical protein
VFNPLRTILDLGDGTTVRLDRLCHEGSTGRTDGALRPRSHDAVIQLVKKLSDYIKVFGLQPGSSSRYFKQLRWFLDVIDLPEFNGQYRHLLEDADTARDALVAANTLIRQEVQAGKRYLNTAAANLGAARRILSLLHEREYADEVEILTNSGRLRRKTVAPEEREVEVFVSTLTATFDLCVSRILKGANGDVVEESQQPHPGNASREVALALKKSVTDTQVLDLACVCFAGISVADSGANEATIAKLEYSKEIDDAMQKAQAVSMRLKEVKLRAGGKEVPIHFTAITRSRLSAYLEIRKRILAVAGDDTLQTLFVRASFLASNGNEIKVQKIAPLLIVMRARLKSLVNIELPKITLRQLRLNSGNKFTELAGPQISAARLGQTLSTAINNYNSASPGQHRDEFSEFFASLAKTAVHAARDSGAAANGASDLSTGGCKAVGNPRKIEVAPADIEPDCRKTEGCLFCDKYAIHADETDIRKLLSCEYVINRLAPSRGSADEVTKLYDPISTRITTLLVELKLRNPSVYSSVEHDVSAEGNLSPYWAAKYSQLCLLGLVTGKP